jgi:hypothetical protein
MISFFGFKGFLQGTPGLADIGSEDIKAVSADSLLAGKSSDFLPSFIDKSNLAIIVRGENTIGNTV